MQIPFLTRVIPLIVVGGLVLIFLPKSKEFQAAAGLSDRQSENCQVSRISDGDTITCGNKKIRFCGIDAPESAQPLGQESKAKLTQLLAGKEVFLVPIETDRYGRTVGELFVKISSTEELFINAEMVRSGMAYHYAQYSNNCTGKTQIIGAENEARSQSVGVWGGNFEKPWDYRRKARS